MIDNLHGLISALIRVLKECNPKRQQGAIALRSPPVLEILGRALPRTEDLSNFCRPKGVFPVARRRKTLL